MEGVGAGVFLDVSISICICVLSRGIAFWLERIPARSQSKTYIQHTPPKIVIRKF